MIPILLCGGSQGRAVVFGLVEAEPIPGTAVTLYEARMVLRWEGTAGLFGLAAVGPAPGSRLTCSVAQVTDCDWKQWMAVTPVAAEAMAAWPAAE